MKSHTFNGRKLVVTADVHIEGYVHTHEIYVDPNLNGSAHLETAVHEGLHACFPAATEATVDRCGKDIARFLWRLGYRR